MNVVDSSAWLEYFADGPNADDFAGPITNAERLVVPSLTLFEVFKRIRSQRSVGKALYAVAQMQRGKVVDVDPAMAVAAAEISVETRLPMAASVVLATARAEGATLWTQDGAFAGLDDVEYRRRGE